MTTNLELVVARCREDLKWLKHVPNDFRVTVYDKGGDAKGAQPLPNIGREAQTYLHHVISHFHELADLTVFSQGKPFDHVPELHRILQHMAARRLCVADFLWLGFIVDRDDRTGSLLFQSWGKNPEGRPLLMDAFWQALWQAPAPEHYVFYPGAHFAVTADTIRKQSRSFYEKALAVSETLPDAAHCFERCWDRVFGRNGIPPELRKRKPPVYLRPVRRLGLTWDAVVENRRAEEDAPPP